MKRRFRTERAFEEPPINITPLIDVVFVILIMFILIAPLVDKEGVQLARGGSGEERELKATSPIALVVRRDSSLLLNKRGVSLEELPLRLKEVRREFPQAIPQLFHDKLAPFGVYQEVKLAFEAAGFSQMELVVEPSAP